jgi:hypothetical protein
MWYGCQGVGVGWHCVMGKEARHHLPQPHPLAGDRIMPLDKWSGAQFYGPVVHHEKMSIEPPGNKQYQLNL